MAVIGGNRMQGGGCREQGAGNRMQGGGERVEEIMGSGAILLGEASE